LTGALDAAAEPDLHRAFAQSFTSDVTEVVGLTLCIWF
jgi:hypothetical protein